MIGSFGDVIFEVSSEVVRTFSMLSKRKSIRLATFDILDGSQKVQYLGENLSEFDFNIRLDARYVDIDLELDKLENMVNGAPYRLVIGGKNFGQFCIQEINNTYKHTDGKGRILTSEVNLRLKEYR